YKCLPQNDKLYFCIRDISYLKQQEANSKEQELLFIHLSEHSNDLISIHDEEGKYIYVSNSVKDLLGYLPEEMIGKSSYDFFHHDDIPDIIQSHQEVLNTSKGYTVSYRIKTKDDRYIWFETNSKIVSNPMEINPSIVCISRNITQRKRQELKVKEHANFLKILMDTIPNPIFFKDIKGRYLGCNKAFETVFGTSQEKLVGKTVWDFVTKEEAGKHFLKDQQLIHSPGVIEYEIKHNSMNQRKERIYLFSKATFQDFKGEVGGIVGVLVDITERKQVEFKINKAKQLAETANQMKSAFLANVSHELRTPMHGILSFSRFGVKKCETAQREKLKEFFTQINESGTNLMLLLNDLLDLSKLESNKVNFEFMEMEVEPLVASLKSEFEALLSERNIELRIDYELEIHRLKIDRSKMLQVFRNLLSNAIKFSPDNKPIIIKIYPGEYIDDKGMIVSFHDQGQGVPEEEREIIFDKFTQSSQSQTGTGGTGLGLAICKEIIRKHHGRIWHEYNFPHGSIFKVFIPFALI
ncbi:MAG: PAS domain-containing sensor histidine kinase, partial [bacterium]